jgi:HK97 family phage prohead protease
MENLETREQRIELRYDSNTRQLSGIAVPYGEVSPSYNERFAPGSVTLDPNALLLWQHDRTEPIGKITSGKESKEGFLFESFISDTTRGRDAATLAADGVLSLSVGFIMRDSAVVNGVTEVRDALVKEISVVSFAAYSGAVVTDVRDDNNTDPEVPDSALSKEQPVEDTTQTASDIADVREAIQHLEREVAEIKTVDVPAAPQYRSAGEFLKAIADGSEAAQRAYTGATTSESVVTPVDVDLIRLVEAANPLGAVFGTGVTPAEGMSITFAKVNAITDGTGVQAAEGDDLGYYELDITTDSEAISTYGNYAELSKQVISRSTIPYLDSVLRGQAIALGKALASALRTKYQAVVAAQVTAGNKVTLASTDYAGWVAGMADAAATYFQPNGVTIDALVVDKATFKDLLALDGTPVISFSGEANGAVGSGNPSGLRGTIAGIPIVVDAGLDSVNKDECAFVSSLALRQYTSGALRLSGENVVNLSETFSLSTFGCVADEHPAFIIPIDQTA